MNILSAVKPVSWSKGSLYGIILVGLFHSSHTMMVRQWDNGDNNYAYLIPLIVVYLIWEKREQLFRTVSHPSWWGLPWVAGGMLFYLLGELGGEYFTLYLSSWLMLIGICWIHLGWQKLRIIAFPLFMVPGMFPLPDFIITKLTLKLQLVSSQLGVAIIQAYGLSAFREGNVIDLGFTQLQVVEACSGLRYLIPLFVLGVLMAYFIRTAVWKKIVFVISTIPLSISTNSLRIAMTGILYESWGQEVAEGFFHGFSGWAIFIFSLIVMLAEIWILKIIPSRFNEADLKSEESTLPKGFGSRKKDSTGAQQLKPSRKGSKNKTSFWYPRQFIVALVLMGAILSVSHGIEFREKTPPARPFDRFPLTVGQWQGVRQAMEAKFLDVLDLSDYVIVDYKDPGAKKTNFYVAYYESQRKGESIHSPASCLPGGGWEFRQSGTTTVDLSGGGSQVVSRAMMQLGDAKQVVYFWYVRGGRILTNAYQLKFWTFWDALTRQRTDGALVRLITRVYHDETASDAEARLQALTREIVPVLNDFVPD